MIENAEGRWVSIIEAAERAGVSRRTIYNWLKAGKLQHRRTASGSARILEASLWDSYTGPRTTWTDNRAYQTPERIAAREQGLQQANVFRGHDYKR